MDGTVGFRLRLRIRLAKALNTEDVLRTIIIEEREVTVQSQKSKEPLSEAKWIVLRASGFPTEEEAWSFGRRLKAIAEVAGLCSRLGVDVGYERSTTWMSEDFARTLGLIQPHERIFPNTHGLSVVPDDDNNRFPLLEAEGTVRAAPEQFLGAMVELAAAVPATLAAAGDGVRILNLAMANPQPIAQIALALSAVEALGQSEEWTVRQSTWLIQLAAEMENDADDFAVERREVADALRRSIHRIGLRQGVLRILNRLGLERLKKEWDRIYSARSGLFHGTSSLTEPEVAQLASDALTLCARVILTVEEQRGVHLPSIASVHFP